MAQPSGSNYQPAWETATLAGGCFWCLEAVYAELEGVNSAISGYVGGRTSKPSYRQVCDGDTGHAEAVQIKFDPTVVSYRDILEIFFVIHDPTTLNRQGNDVGTQYRSAIFTHSPEQKAAARRIIEELTAEQAFDDAIVTEIVPAGAFWPAEDYHQEYFKRNAHEPYCQVVVAPKLAKFRKTFAERLKR